MLRFCANIGFLFPELPFLDRFAAARAPASPRWSSPPAYDTR